MENVGLSHPLHIDTIHVPDFGGCIGLTHCPGRKCAGPSTESGQRDLDADLRAIQAWGAELLVSLIEKHEYAAAGVEALPQRIPEGMAHLELPIRDMAIPDEAWEIAWLEKSPIIRSILRRGGRICVHCMGGFGRSGLVAAKILTEFGIRPDRALHSVREARPGTVETPDQENYVLTRCIQ